MDFSRFCLCSILIFIMNLSGQIGARSLPLFADFFSGCPPHSQASTSNEGRELLDNSLSHPQEPLEGNMSQETCKGKGILSDDLKELPGNSLHESAGYQNYDSPVTSPIPVLPDDWEAMLGLPDETLGTHEHPGHTEQDMDNKVHSFPNDHESVEELHVNKKQKFSSDSIENGSASSHVPVRQIENTSASMASAITHPIQSAIGKVEQGKSWVTQQRNKFSSQYTQNLNRLEIVFKQFYLDNGQTKPAAKHLLNNSAVLMGKRKLHDGSTRVLNWIFNLDDEPLNISRSIGSWDSLITFMTSCNIIFLKQRHHLEDKMIEVLNNELLSWLLGLIFNPPTGYPLIGLVTAANQALVKIKKEPKLTPMGSLLSRYLSGSEIRPDLKTLSGFLMHFWYAHTQTLSHPLTRQEDRKAIEEAVHRAAVLRLLSLMPTPPSQSLMENSARHMNAGNVDPIQATARRLQECKLWMSQQFDSFSLRYNQNLNDLNILLEILSSAPNGIQIIPEKHPIQDSNVVMMIFNKLQNPQVFNMIFSQSEPGLLSTTHLVGRLDSVIKKMTRTHFILLKKLFISDDLIKIQNQKLIDWLLVRTFNPSNGIPLIGLVNVEKMGNIQANKPMVDSLLSQYLSGSTNIETLPGHLINSWYSETKTLKHSLTNEKDLIQAIRECEGFSMPN